jgi:hypothetical protein
VDAVGDAVAQGEVLGGGAVGAVADEQQARGHGGAMRAKTSTTSSDALDGAEVGEVNEEAFVGAAKRGRMFGDEFGVANVEVAVDEVADDFDLAGDAEGLAGAVAQVAGDGGDAVGLVDAEAGDGEVGAVEADEGDVGAVERGDEGQMFAARGEHLAGEQALTLCGMA